MEFSLLIGIMVIAYSPLILVKGQSQDKEYKVKLTGAYVKQKDTNYYKFVNLKVVPDTDTHGKLSVELENLQDLPTDILYTGRISESNKKADGTCSEDYSQTNTYLATICNNSIPKNADHLPKGLAAIKKAGTCLKKGPYKNDDYGIFQFYNLLFDSHLTKRCYKFQNEIKSGDKILYLDELSLISND